MGCEDLCDHKQSSHKIETCATDNHDQHLRVHTLVVHGESTLHSGCRHGFPTHVNPQRRGVARRTHGGFSAVATPPPFAGERQMA